MYTGNMIEELIDMVARAEDRAVQRIILAPPPPPVEPSPAYAARLWYDSSAAQSFLVGVA